MQKQHKVFCLTPAPFCVALDLYLGQAKLGQALRCPICGRYSAVDTKKTKKRAERVKSPLLRVPA